MKVYTASLFLSLLIMQSWALEKYFFPGSKPEINEGSLHIGGYYIETDQTPLALSAVRAGILEQEIVFPWCLDHKRQFPDTESRGRPASDTDDVITIPVPPPLFPFRVTDTVLSIRIVPPLCVACACLQGGQSCAQAGGAQLVTLTLGSVLGGIIDTVTGAIACARSVNGAAAAGLPLAVPVAPGTGVLTCLFTPFGNVSACDPSCVSTPPGCLAIPTAANCPRIPQPAVCNTQCRDRNIGDPVRCNAAFQGVISPRPNTACVGLRKREAQDTSYAPNLESSIEDSGINRRGRLFGLGISRFQVTRSITRAGSVTATYVATDLCLPSNILQSPNC